jgi:predicted RNA binding protein YcfA (HicA-like mRNA interferase family)
VSRLKQLPYHDLAKIAQMGGFRWMRCSDSHNTFQAEDGRIVVIPNHGSQVIVRPLLRKIIRDLGINVDEYNQLIKKL